MFNFWNCPGPPAGLCVWGEVNFVKSSYQCETLIVLKKGRLLQASGEEFVQGWGQ